MKTNLAIQSARRSILWALLVLCFLAFTVHAAETNLNPRPIKSTKFEPGADLFTNGPVLRIRIDIPNVQYQSLRHNPRQYVPATIREGANTYTNVGIHVKGAAGSSRPIDDKPALTLSFGKFADGQRFHGLRKIHLNNSVQDPSYMTELVCGGLFHASGVPAPRVTHARVMLNGRDLGFYVLIEGFTRDFIGRYFKKTKGNLYDGGFLLDITDNLARTSGESPDTSDLKNLVAAAAEPNLTKRWERLNQVLDMDRFLNYMAMEVMTWDWDGYVMKRNNYRIYHDPTSDKMVFMPHGMDQMFWESNGPLRPHTDGLVADAVMKTPEGRRLYRERLSLLFTNVFKLPNVIAQVNAVQARIRPALAEYHRGAALEHDQAVAELRARITQRWQGIQRQLAIPEPKGVKFGESGVFHLSGWRQHNQMGTAKLVRFTDADGKETLHVAANGNSIGSWRTKALLENGHYRFEAQARTAGVKAIGDDLGDGAGLRISGSRQQANHKLVGDTSWKKLVFEFDVVAPLAEVEFVCELRATKGEAWFDASSLQLVRVKQ